MHDVMQQLVNDRVTPITIILWTALAMLLSTAAGAVAGITIGGKDLGNSLAALMGAMYGPVAAVPAILAALIILALTSSA